MNLCSRNLTVLKIKSISGEGSREIILGSAYLPYDDIIPPPTRKVEKLVDTCQTEGSHLVIGCDANSHHIAWGSCNINNRGESLYHFNVFNYYLDIFNVGKRPTFVTSRRQEIIDTTVATSYLGTLINPPTSHWGPVNPSVFSIVY